MITMPFRMQLTEWADILVSELSQFGTFNRLTDEAKWQDWAAQFVANPTLQNRIPQPYGFDNWQEWAERLCQTLD